MNIKWNTKNRNTKNRIIKRRHTKKRKNTNKGGRPLINNTPQNIEKMSCSPIVKGKTVNNVTCFTVDTLMKIVKEYNKTHTQDQIKDTDPEKIWFNLHSRLTHCKKEDCWLDVVNDPVLKREIDEYIFAPDHPPEWNSKPNEWLSNHDILNVLEQYEDTHPIFEFIGPTPIDFDTKPPSKSGQCVWKDLCTFSLDEHIKNKKTKIGIIFNLDKHYQGGSHWVSLFIDLDDKIIMYFDSAGSDIPSEIAELKNRIVKQGKKQNMVFKFYKNYPKTHQYTNTECGMYSLFFIITMLTSKIDGDILNSSKIKGLPTQDGKKMSVSAKIALFNKKHIPDKFVEKYRKIYFNS
jgi:hypothetical protein